MAETQDDVIEVPVSCLVNLYVALRLSDQPDEDLRLRRADIAIASLPMTVRQRVTREAAQKLRQGLGLDTPFSGTPGHL